MEGELKTHCAIQLMCPLSIFIPIAVLHFWSISVWVSKVKISANRNMTSLCVGSIRKKEVVCLFSLSPCWHLFRKICSYSLKSLFLWDREYLLETVFLKSSVFCFSCGADIKKEDLQCTCAKWQHILTLLFRQCTEKMEPPAGSCSLSKEKSYVR